LPTGLQNARGKHAPENGSHAPKSAHAPKIVEK